MRSYGRDEAIMGLTGGRDDGEGAVYVEGGSVVLSDVRRAIA
jgi:hypothetical protein